MKLNLGCGPRDLRVGYINVDQRLIDLPTPQGVEFVHYDLSMMPWAWLRDQSVSEILMLDILEHFPMSQTAAILGQCWRVLERSGELVVQVPDATAVMRSILQDNDYSCLCRKPVSKDAAGCAFCGRVSHQIRLDARERLFGGQDYPGNFHQTCFTEAMLKLELYQAGFDDFVDEHELAGDHWNIRFRCRRSR